MKVKKKVFVSGCFDLLHSGHVYFLEQASKYGSLYVCLGSDSTILDLKGRASVINQNERKYILESLKFVHKCVIGSGEGILDFKYEIEKIKPDYFIVNEDGANETKKDLCEKLGIKYIILERLPNQGLPVRSTTSIREHSLIPYRIDLAGGWLDQPFISKICPGPVLTISIEPTIEFNHRSGMATSSRNCARKLWGIKLPNDDNEKLAKILFSYENPPGKKEISGSQDHIGIIYPCLNKLNYNGKYWPESIESIFDEEILKFIENSISLIPLLPRENDYDVLGKINKDLKLINKLSESATNVWNSIKEMNIKEFGKAFKESFEAQVSIFPNMIDNNIIKQIKKYENQSLGYKISGAGGGGYLIFVSENQIPNSIKIKIRRKNEL